MTDIVPIEPEEIAAQQTFARRRRTAAVIMAIAGLTHLFRYAPLAASLPTGLAWLADMWLWSSFLVAGALIWTFRCPVCRGGIRLDGKTCASCGRVFGIRT